MRPKEFNAKTHESVKDQIEADDCSWGDADAASAPPESDRCPFRERFIELSRMQGDAEWEPRS